MIGDCRTAEAPEHPCPFVGVCHEARRAIAVQAGINGMRCPWFQHLALVRPELMRAHPVAGAQDYSDDIPF